MKISEIDEIERDHTVKTENSKYSKFERVIRRSGGDPHCFYCDFSLECGQQECIWREGCD